MPEASPTPTSSVEPPFTVATAPWKCKGDTYWIPYYTTGPLPEDAYAPLEANTPSFSSPSHAGEFRGGLGTIQVVRYHETPVGRYDELILVPGSFQVPKGRGSKRKTLRITRIYVSQKETTYNGRINWNIPKHLARFSFERLTSPDRLKVQVFPPSPSSSTISETDKPFFSATFQPFSYTPAFPFSTKIFPWICVDSALTQPPLLPQSSGEEGGEVLPPELRAGSKEWLQVLPLVTCRKARGSWVSCEQPDKTGNEGVVQAQGWFPVVHPWKVGMYMENSELVFGIPKVL